MYKFSRNKKLSKFVSSKIIDLKDKKLKDSMIEKKFEEGVDLFSSIENKQKNFESDTLFFASQESHLKVFQSFFEIDYNVVVPIEPVEPKIIIFFII